MYTGDVWVTPNLAASLLMDWSRIAPQSRFVSPSHGLTRRGHEILTLVAAEKSSKEIGQQLFLVEKIIKHYMTNILQKLHVRNRVEVAMLLQQGGESRRLISLPLR